MSNKKQKVILKMRTDDFIESFKSAIMAGGKIKISDFGIFELKKMRSRKGYNPATKEHEQFPEYIKISFTPTSSLKEYVQKWKKH